MSFWNESLNMFAASWLETLIRVCWQGGLALALVWAVCRLLPRLPAWGKCWLWRLAYLKLLFAFLWLPTLDLPLLPPVDPPQATTPPQEFAMAAPTTSQAIPADGLSSEPQNTDPAPAVMPTVAGWLLLLWTGSLLWQSGQAIRQGLTVRQSYRSRLAHLWQSAGACRDAFRSSSLPRLRHDRDDRVLSHPEKETIGNEEFSLGSAPLSGRPSLRPAHARSGSPAPLACRRPGHAARNAAADARDTGNSRRPTDTHAAGSRHGPPCADNTGPAASCGDAAPALSHAGPSRGGNSRCSADAHAAGARHSPSGTVP